MLPDEATMEAQVEQQSDENMLMRVNTFGQSLNNNTQTENVSKDEEIIITDSHQVLILHSPKKSTDEKVAEQ